MTHSKSSPKMHASFYVSNIEATTAFYNHFFDTPPTKMKSDYVKYELAEPALVISFVQNPAKVNNTFGHLGFRVDTIEAVKNKMETMKEAGIAVKEEFQEVCCYALQDKFWAADPDGINWEVYYLHNDVEADTVHSESKETTESLCCSADIGSACC